MAYAQEQIKPYTGNACKREQVEQMFNHIAPTYDRLNHTLSFGTDRRWRHQAIRLLQSYHPQEVMDLATGTGDFALLLAKELQPKKVWATDISEGMMAVGREKAALAGLTSVIQFQKEDSSRLSFADNSMDAVTVSFGVRNFESLDVSLQEIHRVLKPQGHLVILELSYPNHFPQKQLFQVYSKVVMPVVGRLISGDNTAYTYLPHSMQAFPQGEVMQQILLKNGFSKASFKRLTMGICTLYDAEK